MMKNRINLKESDIVRQIREMLKILRVPHFKHWGGPMGEKGIPDIIGIIPGSGRALYVEVKKPGGKTTGAQSEFLATAADAGALAMVAYDAEQVLWALKDSGYAPASRLSV